jgi:hypothetical protein
MFWHSGVHLGVILPGFLSVRDYYKTADGINFWKLNVSVDN